jgi:hypothetical protein
MRAPKSAGFFSNAAAPGASSPLTEKTASTISALEQLAAEFRDFTNFFET